MSTLPQSLNSDVLGVDIDNVLCDTDALIRKIIHKKYGLESTQSQIIHWRYSDSLSISKEQESEVFDLFHKKYCADVEPVFFSSNALKILSQSYSIWLLTSRPAEAEALTKQWLYRNNITYSNLIFSNQKIEYSDKVKIIVEDKWETALEFAENGLSAFLFEKPWNKDKPYHPRVQRVSSWKQVLMKLQINQPLEVA